MTTVSDQKQTIGYRDAGVDIDAGDALVEAIKPIAKSTFREGCISDLGGFGALFEVPKRFRQPVLVSGTDGVGTKLKFAFQENRHDTIGIDLVAMCVNDVLVQGAEPLFFLDYFATGALSQDVAIDVVRGIADGCKQAGAALIGGETAEMPGMYQAGEYDLAGFCVGVVERDQMIDGANIQAGDVIIGLGSSGFHSNGYSLIRKVIDTYNLDTTVDLQGESLASRLLAPTRIYVRSILELIKQVNVRGLAHITGGGLHGNIKRILPNDAVARIDTSAWSRPQVYPWLQNVANITEDEMYKTFNCGVGMVLIVSAPESTRALKILSAREQAVGIIGEIGEGNDGPEVILS